MSVLKDYVLELVKIAERLSARYVKLATKLSGCGGCVEVCAIKEPVFNVACPIAIGPIQNAAAWLLRCVAVLVAFQCPPVCHCLLQAVQGETSTHALLEASRGTRFVALAQAGPTGEHSAADEKAVADGFLLEEDCKAAIEEAKNAPIPN